nr:chaperone modulator CbpM [Enterovirga rhinocerotis]
MSRQDFLACSGLEGQTLEIWLEQRWIIPEPSGEGAAFSDRDVARARLIQELIRDFGVNHEGVDVILHLTDQLHGLRQALSELRSENLGRKPAPQPL